MLEEFLSFVAPVADYFKSAPLWGTIWVYLALINIYVFFLCRHDKLMAIKERQRVPERDFFVLSFFGGSVGMIIGMYAFRHKTKHISFVLGIPFIIAVQICLVLLVVFDGDVNLIWDATVKTASETAKSVEDALS